MADDYVLKISRYDTADKRLGRHVVHDSRSLRYQYKAKPRKALRSMRHNINIPILDQGDVGSCTGHAGTYAIASDPFWKAAQGAGLRGDDTGGDHSYAVGLYSDATKVDPWPGQYLPDDTGSDGLSIAKVLLARGLISGYQHATSLDAALAALSERVVIVGTSWLDGMYDPRADGRLTVTGNVAGGHEYALDEIDVEQQRVFMRNSWGPGWGVKGRAWMTFDDLKKLLADDGDCTILIPNTEPAPTPAPVPTPTPAPNGFDNVFGDAMRRFLRSKGCPTYIRKPAEAWLASFPKE